MGYLERQSDCEFAFTTSGIYFWRDGLALVCRSSSVWREAHHRAATRVKELRVALASKHRDA